MEKIKYTYCYIKINRMYLKEFYIYNKYEKHTSFVDFSGEFTYTTEKEDAAIIKIEDAHFLVKLMGDGVVLDYVC